MTDARIDAPTGTMNGFTESLLGFKVAVRKGWRTGPNSWDDVWTDDDGTIIGMLGMLRYGQRVLLDDDGDVIEQIDGIPCTVLCGDGSIDIIGYLDGVYGRWHVEQV